MEIRAYLGDLEHELRLEPHQRTAIVAEIAVHLEERLAELEDQGVPHEAAEERTVHELGDSHNLAKGLYSSHSAGSWRDVLLATLPHLVLAGLFAFHLSTDLFWVIVALGGATLIAVLAWRMGRPQWAYPWLGYAVAAPALTWLLAMAAVGYGIWTVLSGGSLPLGLPLYLGIVLWIPVSMVIVLRLVRRAVLHDWLVVSLAALPLPFIATWLFLMHWRGGQLVPDRSRAISADADTAMVFLALAITTALYMKMGRRGWRIALMMIAAPLLAAVVTIAYQNSPSTFSVDGALTKDRDGGTLAMVMVFVLTAAFLLSPILMDPLHKTTRGPRRDHKPPSAAP